MTGREGEKKKTAEDEFGPQRERNYEKCEKQTKREKATLDFKREKSIREKEGS